MDIDFKTKISTLNPRQRAWFATAMVAMILADGNIDRAEVEFIVKIVALVKDDTMVERLKKFIQFKTTPPLGPPPELDRKLAMSMVLDLVRIAVSDMNFAPPEKDMINKIGRSMGFSEEELNKLIMYGFELMGGNKAAAAS
jgi:uncharacterized tellurite resistance protein B-like protein